MVERLTLQVTELEDSMQDLTEQNQSLRNRNSLLAQEMEAVQEEVGGVHFASNVHELVLSVRVLIV